MSNDWHITDAEDEFKEDRERAICHDAAILVVTKDFPRKAALAKAEIIFDTQQDAMNDPTGVIGTLSEAQSPTMPDHIKKQVEAIAQELYDERN